MERVEFVIKEIIVSKSTMGGYGLDISLKDGTQLENRFFDENLYINALQAKGNLVILHHLFRDIIQNILNNSSQHFYLNTNCELFYINLGNILEDPEEDLYHESMELIRSCAVEKEIEFDGYYNQRWIDSANTIINFDEEYFNNADRRDLYIYLSALVDEEIFEFLNSTYYFFQRHNISKKIIEEKISHLTKIKNVRF